MKKLEISQMEGLQGEGNTIDCALAMSGIFAGAIAITSIGMVTGGLGFALWGVGMGGSVASMVRSC
jgi:hypothetical protein